MWAGMKRVVTQVSVEPIMLLFTLSRLEAPAMLALFYRKVCLTMFTPGVCEHLSNGSFPQEEDAVQAQTSHWFLYTIICFEVPSIFMSTIYGTICDSWSRKATLMLPLVGQILSTLNTIAVSAVRDSPVGLLLLGRLVSGFFGGWVTMFMACTSYLSASTDVKSRTTRIAVLEGICSVTSAVAGLLSGIILDKTSFLFVFLLTVGIHVLALLYTFIFVKELNEDKNDRIDRPSEIQKKLYPRTVLRMIAATFKTATKKRKHNLRRQLGMVLLCMFTSFIGYAGESDVLYEQKCEFGPDNSWRTVGRNFWLSKFMFHCRRFILMADPAGPSLAQ